MRLKNPGKSTSAVEIVNISEFGLWVSIEDKEYFLSFEDFPWFKNARINEIHNVELSSGSHLYWPDLDVDLNLDIINSPEKFPLTSKAK